MHVDNAKQQRAVVKEVLKRVASEVLQEREDALPARLEYEACIDHWKCDMETTTRPEDLLLSSIHEQVLHSVSI